MGGIGLMERCYPGDRRVTVADQLTTEERGELRGGEGELGTVDERYC